MSKTLYYFLYENLENTILQSFDYFILQRIKQVNYRNFMFKLLIRFIFLKTIHIVILGKLFLLQLVLRQGLPHLTRITQLFLLFQ